MDRTPRTHRLALAALAALFGLATGCVDDAESPEPGPTTFNQALDEAAPAQPVPAVADMGGLDFQAILAEASHPDTQRVARACAAGQADQCYELGDRYHGGDRIRRDNWLAVDLIDHACQAGYQRACYDLGARYLMGTVVERDVDQAARYFQQTCAADYAYGCYMLGRIAHEGIGRPVDLKMATTLFDRSCQLGYLAACERVAFELTEDVGRWQWQLPADAPEALLADARTCDAGIMSGCLELAEALEAGDGVPVDREMAYALYDHACDWGLLAACTPYRAMQP